MMIHHGHHVLSQCPKQKHFPPEILKMATKTEGGMLLFRALARSMVPMKNHHASYFAFLSEPVSLYTLYSLFS